MTGHSQEGRAIENKSLMLDLVEWIARVPRPYAEVMDAWRTSCPRFTIWEDALDLGFITCRTEAGLCTMVEVTSLGQTLLHGERGGSTSSKDTRPVTSPQEAS